MITINIEKSVVNNDIFPYYVVVEYNGIPLTLGVRDQKAALKMQQTAYRYIKYNGIEKFINLVSENYNLDVDEIY